MQLETSWDKGIVLLFICIHQAPNSGLKNLSSPALFSFSPVKHQLDVPSETTMGPIQHQMIWKKVFVHLLWVQPALIPLCCHMQKHQVLLLDDFLHVLWASRVKATKEKYHLCFPEVTSPDFASTVCPVDETPTQHYPNWWGHLNLRYKGCCASFR